MHCQGNIRILGRYEKLKKKLLVVVEERMNLEQELMLTNGMSEEEMKDPQRQVEVLIRPPQICPLKGMSESRRRAKKKEKQWRWSHLKAWEVLVL